MRWNAAAGAAAACRGRRESGEVRWPAPLREQCCVGVRRGGSPLHMARLRKRANIIVAFIVQVGDEGWSMDCRAWRGRRERGGRSRERGAGAGPLAGHEN